jgi:hypothetical protein
MPQIQRNDGRRGKSQKRLILIQEYCKKIDDETLQAFFTPHIYIPFSDGLWEPSLFLQTGMASILDYVS